MNPDATRLTPVAPPIADDTHASRSTRPDLSGLPDIDPPAGFELLEVVGKGGMGVVFRAREKAFDREVALKFLLGDTPEPALTVRFLDEARITGQLQHPGIPAAYRTGLLADGRPYLAMKLIKGRTLDALLAERGTGATRWLGVFEGIAQAVGYAHAHGVIHRDLKPHNVMVGAFGEVQVMDWGLARVVRSAERGTRNEETAPPVAVQSDSSKRHSASTIIHSLRDGEDRTQAGSILGTPAYMPPEQAGGDIDALGPPADVFGLGGILCALLTGRPPYTGPDARSTLAMAVQGDLTDAFARLNACGAESELVALCKRCLSVTPADRPANGAAVAKAVADLRAAADDRAMRAEVDRAKVEVEAVAQQKRRRLQLIGGGLLVGVLAVGMVGTGVGYLTAEQSRKQADEARGKEKERADGEAKARKEADEAKALAETKRKEAVASAEEERRAKAVAEAIDDFFLGDVIRQADTGYQADARYRPDPNLTVRQALDRAAAQVGSKFAGQERVEAAVRDALADAYIGLGDGAKAVPHAERAWALHSEKLGPNAPLTLRSLNYLAVAYQKAGRIGDALPLLEQLLRRRRESNGEGHPDALIAQHNLGYALTDADRTKEAVPLLEDLIARAERAQGETGEITLSGMNALGRALTAAGRYDDAVKVLTLARARRSRTQPDDHPSALVTLVELATAHANADRPTEAIPLYERAVAGRQRSLGRDHPDTLFGWEAFGQALLDADRPADAVTAFEEGVAGWRRRGEAGTLPAAHVLLRLAKALYVAGRFADAIPAGEEALAGLRAAAGPENPDTVTARHNLAACYTLTRRYDEAVALFAESYRLAVKRLGPSDQETVQLRRHLISTARQAGRFDLARTAVLEQHEVNRRGLKPGSPEMAFEFARVGNDLLQVRCYDEAEAHLRKALDGAAGWQVSFVESLIGGAVAGQKRYADAEPLLLKGYDGLVANRRALPVAAREFPFEAGQRVIALYASWDKPQKAAEWRAKAPREVLPAPRAE